MSLMAFAAAVGSSSAAVVAQSPSNSSIFTAQVLNTAFSNEFVAEIEGSSNLFAQHATVQGIGNDLQAWYFFSHIGGDMVIDIDDSTLSGEGPTPNLTFGLFNAIGILLATSDGQSFLDAGSSNLHDPLIVIDDAAPINYYVAVLASGGTFGDGFTATGAGAPTGSAYNLHVTVPEPSVALLGLVSAGLMFRRRRA